MKIVCPCCATAFPLEAGLIEGDGKRLAAIMGNMEPMVARAAMSYLRLFKPAKQELRLTKATQVLTELNELIAAGRVSRDERTGLYRPCHAAHWVQGMEQLQTNQRLELPLKNHNYLRAIVYGIADSADAKAEQQQHQDAQQRPKTSEALQSLPVDPTLQHRIWLKQQLDRGLMTKEQCAANLEEYLQKRALREAPAGDR